VNFCVELVRFSSS